MQFLYRLPLAIIVSIGLASCGSATTEETLSVATTAASPTDSNVSATEVAEASTAPEDEQPLAHEALADKTEELREANVDLVKKDNYCQALYDFSKGNTPDADSRALTYRTIEINAPDEVAEDAALFAKYSLEYALAIETAGGDTVAAVDSLSPGGAVFVEDLLSYDAADPTPGVFHNVADSFRWYCQGK